MKTTDKNTLKSYKTFLPIFPGFYGTIFEPQEDNEIEYINEQRAELGMEPADFNDMQFNYKEYMREVSKKACYFIEDKLNELDFKATVNFEELISPREYNFTNDSINCEIEIDKAAVIKYVEDHKTELAAYFIDKFTSYDGFISFYPPYVDFWIDSLKDDTNEDAVILGSILDAILLNEDAEHIIESMYEYAAQCTPLECINTDELTTHPTNEELNTKYSTAKARVFLEMEIIKERIFDNENTGVNWSDLANLNKVLADLKEIKEILKPF